MYADWRLCLFRKYESGFNRVTRWVILSPCAFPNVYRNQFELTYPLIMKCDLANVQY